jgi:hypothetical protein
MKLFQITQVLEGWYVLELTFYCLFKLQCFTKLGQIEGRKKERKNQFPRELNEVIPNNTSYGGVVRIRIYFLLSF